MCSLPAHFCLLDEAWWVESLPVTACVLSDQVQPQHTARAKVARLPVPAPLQTPVRAAGLSGHAGQCSLALLVDFLNMGPSVLSLLFQVNF